MVVGGCLRIDGCGRILSVQQCAIPYGAPQQLPAADILDCLGSFDRGNYFYQPEVFFSRDIWERSGAFLWEKAFYAMDYELWLRMSLAGARIVHIPPILASSRDHDGQKTRLNHGQWHHQYYNFMKFYESVFAEMSKGVTPI